MIRFPRQHIADSVAGRILDAERRFMEMDQEMTRVAAQGAALDDALAQPPGDMAAPEGIEDALVARSLGV